MWLSEARRRRGLTQRALAKAVNRAPQVISTYERGLARVPDDVAAALTGVLRLDEGEVRRGLGLYVPVRDGDSGGAGGDTIRLPPGAVLTAKQRRALDALLDAFLDDLEREQPP